MTQTPASLADALLALQADLPTVSKRQVAKVETQKGSYSYKYAGLAAVSAAILPRLNRLGLVFIARPTLVDGRPVLLCELLHVATGEKLEAQYPLSVAPNSPAQAIGSAISYGRRYCLTAMVGVVAEDDDDGRAASIRYDEQEQPDRQGSRRREPSPPKAISEPQLRKIMALMNKSGVVEREQRLRFCSEVAGRELSSSNDLTQKEAGLVIESLEQALAEPRDENPDGGTA